MQKKIKILQDMLYLPPEDMVEKTLVKTLRQRKLNKKMKDNLLEEPIVKTFPIYSRRPERENSGEDVLWSERSLERDLLENESAASHLLSGRALVSKKKKKGMWILNYKPVLL